jgi:baculoviral IAP repeat-containing protein 6
MSSEPAIIDLLDDISETSSGIQLHHSKSPDVTTRRKHVATPVNSEVVSLLDDDASPVNNSFPITLNDLTIQTPHYTLFCAMQPVLKELISAMWLPTRLEWYFRDATQCTQPIFHIKSARYRDKEYVFRLSFLPDFPTSPPSLEVLCFLPALEYCVLSRHPALLPRLWSSETPLSLVFCTLLRMLENSVALANEADLATPLLAQTSYLQENTLEQRIALLYAEFVMEIKSTHKSLEKLFDALVPADLCVCLGSFSTSSGSGTSMPKNTGGKGTGYSRSDDYEQHAEKKTQNTRDSRLHKLLVAVNQELVAALPAKANVLKRAQQLTRLATWVIQSPLPEILAHIMQEFSREEMYRRTDALEIIAALTLRLDWLLHNLRQLKPASVSVSVPASASSSSSSTGSSSSTDASSGQESDSRLEDVQTALLSIFSKIRSADEESLFDKQRKWLKDLRQHAWLYAHAPITTIPAVQSTSSQQQQKQQPQSSSGASRIHYVPDLIKYHDFMTGSSKAKINNGPEASSKHWLRELRCISDNLPEEVTLFVCDEHPNYLVALLCPINDDCPYFAGSFLFHIKVPSRYPQMPPSVVLVTTGDGTVRFNPNLYNCGKVCLSLLGTWSGEPWNPKESNLTQVLKSILYLIFVEEPYYNEPGYVRPIYRPNTVDRPSINYSVAVMKNTLQYAAMYHLQSPEKKYGIPLIQETIWRLYVDHWFEDSEDIDINSPAATAKAIGGAANAVTDLTCHKQQQQQPQASLFDAHGQVVMVLDDDGQCPPIATSSSSSSFASGGNHRKRKQNELDDAANTTSSPASPPHVHRALRARLLRYYDRFVGLTAQEKGSLLALVQRMDTLVQQKARHLGRSNNHSAVHGPAGSAGGEEEISPKKRSKLM